MFFASVLRHLPLPAFLLATSLSCRADNNAGFSTNPSPVIDSVAPEGPPVVPMKSNGDLWLNTWADDGELYSSWGDGQGPGIRSFTDCGIARLLGDLPNVYGEIRSDSAPKTNGKPSVNDKPSSLLYIDKQLIGAFHSPLGDAWIGYLAVSQDLGATWQRLGFYNEKEAVPDNASPWTRQNKSNFRCLFFINMGQSYRLNTDGYVYALGIGTEWNWLAKTVYLCRVPRDKVLTYSAYTYFIGMADGKPGWSVSQEDAKPLDGVHISDQGAAMYHPQLGRYIFLTRSQVFDAPAPWGPWTISGSWNDEDCGKNSPNFPQEWQGGYQPGIVSKDTGPDWFWFTFAGQNKLPRIAYELTVGKMHLVLKPHASASVIKDPLSQSVAEGTKVVFSVTAAGAGPFTYQWMKDGINLPGTTQANLILASPTVGDRGNYNCTVTNSQGSATSGSALLLVIKFNAP